MTITSYYHDVKLRLRNIFSASTNHVESITSTNMLDQTKNAPLPSILVLLILILLHLVVFLSLLKCLLAITSTTFILMTNSLVPMVVTTLLVVLTSPFSGIIHHSLMKQQNVSMPIKSVSHVNQKQLMLTATEWPDLFQGFT